MQSNHSPMKARRLPVLPIPYVPDLVDLEDLQSNNKLLSEEQIANVKKQLKNAAKGRHKKQELGINYDIIKTDNDYYAIYKGAQQGKALGEGAKGVAKLTQSLKDGKWYVLKVINEEKNNQDKIIEKKKKKKQKKKKKAKKTEESQIEIKDPNIVNPADEKIILKKLRKHIFQYKRKNKTGQNNEEILMELAYGDSMTVFCYQNKLFAPIVYFNLIEKLLEAEQSLLAKRILHRDIKPQNIIYFLIQNHLRIIDFGSAKFMDKKSNEYQSRGGSGTPTFWAPEIDDTHGTSLVSYNEKTEIFEIGMTICGLLGIYYDQKKRRLVPIKMDDDYICFRDKVLNASMREAIIAYLSLMTHPDASKRPTVNEALKKFISFRDEYLDKLSKINQVGVIDLALFFSLNDKKRQKLIENAKLMDQLVFCDKEGRYRQQYVAAAQLFKRENIHVDDSVLQYTNRDDDLLVTLKRYFANQSQAMSRTDVGYFFVDQASVNNEKFYSKLYKNDILFFPFENNYAVGKLVWRDRGLPVSDDFLSEVISQLKKEMNRLEMKEKKDARTARIEALQKTIDVIDNHATSYGLLINQLMLLMEKLKIYNTAPTSTKTYKSTAKMLKKLHKNTTLDTLSAKNSDLFQQDNSQHETSFTKQESASSVEKEKSFKLIEKSEEITKVKPSLSARQ